MTVDAFPDRKYDGVIAEISPEANRQKATVQVKVQILNPDDYLRPEMNSTVKFIADEPSKKSSVSSPAVGVFVPTNAVRDRAGKKVVFSLSRTKPCSVTCGSSPSAAGVCLWKALLEARM